MPTDNRLIPAALAAQTAQLPAAWLAAFSDRPVADALAAVTAHVEKRLAEGATVYPATPFRALHGLAPSDVRVVILGQDPYHGRGQAEGLAFSVAPGVRLPPSLQNIFKEMQRDLGVPFPPFPQPGGSLVKWAQNGVLLLNTCLTVEEGQAASHSKRGWEVLTDAVIRQVAEQGKPTVFMLWGSHAQSKRVLIPADRGHLVLMSNHPSPLSALRPPVPFIGNGHFGQAKAFREQLGY